MARYDPVAYKRPADVRKTLNGLMHFVKGSRRRFLIAALAALANGIISVFGTYSYKLIINDFIIAKDPDGLLRAVALLGAVYLAGALASLIYSQLMAKTAQDVVFRMRSELFSKMQTLPLSFFDTHSAGDLMSRFTNDLDTVSEGISNSYAALVQSVGGLISTVAMLVAIDPWLALVVLGFEALTFVYIRYATVRSRYFYRAQ